MNEFLNNLVTLKDLVKIFKGQLSERTIRREIQAGMPYIKIAGKLFFDLAKVENYIKTNKVGITPE